MKNSVSVNGIFAFFILFSFSLYGQRPKVGLTLSGGGAKGLAHVGILQAIDSAGLKIDYITGTSMGSVIGAMYAAGYSGDSIYTIASQINWDDLLALKTSLSNVSIEEKEEFDRYSIELAMENGKIKLSSGILEAQELWIKFSELFMPVFSYKNFSNLSIPFKCIATDLSTGKAVVLDTGEITTAIRASMAIPTAFTAVEYNGTKLVDGGTVRNFPVTEVKEMGADLVIGSSVTAGLQNAYKLTSPIDMLYQIGSFKDADDYQMQKKFCDIYIHPDLSEYSAASFSDAETIFAIGKKEGENFYPYFKALADSLNSIEPVEFVKNRLPETDSIVFDEINVLGLKNTTGHFFKGKLNLKLGKAYNSKQIANAIRNIYGTTRYERITYAIYPSPGSNHVTINFIVRENPIVYLKQSLHYNTFSDIALIASLSTRRFIFDKSNAFVKLNLSENIRIKALYQQYINNANTLAFELSAYHENIKLPLYDNFKESQLFRNFYSNAQFNLVRYFNRTAEGGIGFTVETNRFKPKLTKIELATIRYSDRNVHAFINLNTLNRSEFPQRGWKIRFVYEYVFNQKPDANYVSLVTGTFNFTDEQILKKDFQRISFKSEKYFQLSSVLTLMNKTELNANIFSQSFSLNQFIVGGLDDFLRNQSTFAGLQESELYTAGISSIQLGLQWEATKNVYLTARSNIGVYDFMSPNGTDFSQSKFLSGYALSIGYLTPFFPVQASVIYCDQTKRVGGSLNFGYSF